MLSVLEFVIGELRCGKRENKDETLKLIIHISEVKFWWPLSSTYFFAFVANGSSAYLRQEPPKAAKEH